MSKQLQDPNVSEYLHTEHEETREKISIEDLIKRIESREPVDMDPGDVVTIIRQGRDSRTRRLAAVTGKKR